MKWSNSLFSRHREDKKPIQGRRRASDRPGPLPAIRERALTLPSPLAQKEARTSDLQQSAFLVKLPPEIRYLIYREVLAPADNPELHIASADRRLLSRRCFNGNSDLPGLAHPCWGHCFKKDGTTAQNPSMGRYEPEANSPYPIRMGLLRSCRQIYSESIDILYSENILSVRQTRTIVDLQRTILPRRLHSIRSLRMDFLLAQWWYEGSLRCDDSDYPFDILFFWESAWNIIPEMKSLQSLRVAFSDGVNERPHSDVVLHLLKPMMAITLPIYMVEFDWPVEVDDLVRKLRNPVPFKLHVKEKPAKA